jgi:hypothetical protein
LPHKASLIFHGISAVAQTTASGNVLK